MENIEEIKSFKNHVRFTVYLHQGRVILPDLQASLSVID